MTATNAGFDRAGYAPKGAILLLMSLEVRQPGFAAARRKKLHPVAMSAEEPRGECARIVPSGCVAISAGSSAPTGMIKSMISLQICVRETLPPSAHRGAGNGISLG